MTTPEQLRALVKEATPGPWELAQRAEDGPWGAAGNIVVALASAHPTLPGIAKPWVASTGLVAVDRTKADARLIALAPQLAELVADMGEALRGILNDDDLPPEWADCECSMCKRIREARTVLARLDALFSEEAVT